MGFWVFMSSMVLVIPIVMIGFGSYFAKKAPKQINNIYGYRTTMSMKNTQTWEFAHHYCGRLWRIIGWIVFVASIIVMLFAIGKDIDYVGIYGLVIVGLQVAVLIVSIFPTEIALKNNFDEFGHRRK